MSPTRATATAIVVVLSLAAVPVAAQDPTPTIDNLTATAGDLGVQVSGTGRFAAPATVVSEDATGDATVPFAGMDLEAASISQVSNAVVRFRLDIADQTPGVSALPQAVYYNWPISVRSGSQTSAYNLQAIRADMYSVATAGYEVGEPVFRLQTCVPNPDTGGNTCSVTARLNGEFGDGYLAIDVPLGVIGGRRADSAIIPGDQAINANLGAGGVWFNGSSLWADAMPPVDDYALGRTVTLGAAAAGTAPEDVELTHPAALTTSNVFDELLGGAAAGSVIAAQVCAAGTCSLESTIAE